MRLGNTVLQFGLDGKLEKLCLGGRTNLLHEYPHAGEAPVWELVSARCDV